MCELCSKSWDDMTVAERDQQIDLLSATFVSLPLVVGAPLILGAEHWLEVARHQVECGVRICPDKPIKRYEPPTDIEATTGGWIYDEAHSNTETARERIVRMAREQREDFEAEVERRRESGDLPAKSQQQFADTAPRRSGNRAARRAAKRSR